MLLAPAAEHLVEEAKLRRDNARQGEKEKGDETHRVVVLVSSVVRGGVGRLCLARDAKNELVVQSNGCCRIWILTLRVLNLESRVDLLARCMDL